MDTKQSTGGLSFNVPDFNDLEQDIVGGVAFYMKRKSVPYIDTSDTGKGLLPCIMFRDGDEKQPFASRILAVRVDCGQLEVIVEEPGADPGDEDSWIDIHSDDLYYADALMSIAGGLRAFTGDMKAEGRTYTFRFYRRAWTDISVTAWDRETAEELASDKYNAGDYDDSDEDFENTDVELIDGPDDEED